MIGVIAAPVASVPVTVTVAFFSGAEADVPVAADVTVPEKLGGIGTTVKAAVACWPDVTVTFCGAAVEVVTRPFALFGPTADTE